MTATGHALIGASLATQITNPVIGLPIIFLSHFVVDKVPHWDVMTNKKNKTKQQIVAETIADVILGFLLVALIFIFYLQSPNPMYIFVSAFVSQLPDFLEFPYVILGLKIFPSYEDYKIQSWIHDVWFNARLQAPWGIVTQAVVVLFFVFWSIA